MYEGYSTYAGVEIVNNQRAWELARAGGAGWYLKRGYPELEVALAGDFADVTEAPWYDESTDESGIDPVSVRFFGVYGLSMGGAHDSTREVPLTQNSGTGGVFGSSRKGTRTARVRAVLLAQGRDALEYGMAWLIAALEGAGCEQDTDCDRGEVLFFAEVPATEDEAQDQRRFLKQASTISGPFVTNESTSRGIYAYEVEWTWASERAFLYGPDRSIDIDVADSFQLIQDSPINFIPYPSAELSGAVAAMATNMNSNPGLEVDATGWTASSSTVSGSAPTTYVAGARSTDVHALGAACYRVRLAGNGVTSASGRAIIKAQADTSLATVPAGRLVGLGVWAATSIVAGSSSAIVAHQPYIQWINGSNVQVGADVNLTADPAGIGLWTLAPTLVPATAVTLRLVVPATVDWSSGATDATNGDIRLYVDALTAYYVRNVS